MQAQDVGLQTCLMADDYEANGRSYMMRKLLAGNYSIRVTPITVSGAGNVSDFYIYIPVSVDPLNHYFIQKTNCVT